MILNEGSKLKDLCALAYNPPPQGREDVPRANIDQFGMTAIRYKAAQDRYKNGENHTHACMDDSRKMEDVATVPEDRGMIVGLLSFAADPSRS